MFFSRPAGHKYIDRGVLGSLDFELGSFTMDDVWHELDLSDKIPKNTKLVRIGCAVCVGEATKQIRFASAGESSLYNRFNTYTQNSGYLHGFMFSIQPTAERKISYNIEYGTWSLFEFILVGYFI